uniref:Uncharacterized protein n=1 Tax=Tanacetum cinerariifolium TaxID=118510 RepID=A0A699JY35_TANCI|nr:hypothetical protein [Tanacetum cinerariifolium]
MAIVRGGKQRGHILGVGRVLPGQRTVIPPPSQGMHLADIEAQKAREAAHKRTGVAGARMMSQEMMRTAARMRRRRTIVRGCGNMLSSKDEGVPFCHWNSINVQTTLSKKLERYAPSGYDGSIGWSQAALLSHNF